MSARLSMLSACFGLTLLSACAASDAYRASFVTIPTGQSSISVPFQSALPSGGGISSAAQLQVNLFNPGGVAQTGPRLCAISDANSTGIVISLVDCGTGAAVPAKSAVTFYWVSTSYQQ